MNECCTILSNIDSNDIDSNDIDSNNIDDKDIDSNNDIDSNDIDDSNIAYSIPISSITTFFNKVMNHIIMTFLTSTM